VVLDSCQKRYAIRRKLSRSAKSPSQRDAEFRQHDVVGPLRLSQDPVCQGVERDWFEDRNPRGLLAILLALALALALAVGLVGYTVVLGSWLPVPAPGKLPPDMHIGPVSWVLAVAGASFGAGMVVSGSCISAHWYRLAEGSVVSPFALVGSALGFVLGFLTWNPLYSLSMADAPVVWLPTHFGYGGALLLQLAVLAALAAWLWRGSGKAAGPTGAAAWPSA